MKNFSLFKIFLKTKIFNIKEFFKNLKFYRKNLKFFIADFLFFIFYFFINPYKISKRFLKKNGNIDIHMYGETPISTFSKIIKNCNLSKENFFLDLGAGRGKCTFFASIFIKCKTLAVEQIPIFINISNFIAKLLRIKIKFLKKDFYFFSDYKDIDVIYLYGSNLEENQIFKLLKKFKNLKKKAKIITISYPLKNYSPKEYKTIKCFSVTFNWGKTLCFLNEKIL